MAGSVGIMQPYFFPYLGYFQLIHAVDAFVFLDDVDYIKGGWINRNKILLNGEPHFITIPLKGASSFKAINEIDLNINAIGVEKLFKKIDQAYKRAPFFSEILDLLYSVFNPLPQRIDQLAIRSCQEVCHYLQLSPPNLNARQLDPQKSGKGQERVLYLCDALNGTEFINPSNGKELYDSQTFEKQGVKLSFLQAAFPEYEQFGGEFIPGLSIIDVLMFNAPEAVREMLDSYTLE